MKPQIGLIGIIQDELKKDFWGTLKKVSGMGYRGLESPWGFEQSGLSREEFRKRLDDLGLKIPLLGTSAESLEKSYGAEVAKFRAMACDKAVIYWSTCASKEEVLGDTARFAGLGKRLRQDGIRLCYHNHDHEFLNVYDGKSAMELIVENSDPADLSIELDVGWAMMGKVDPAEWIRRLKGRCPVLHLKDFYDLNDRKSFTELGTGLNDFKKIFKAAEESGVEWGIVEQDTMRSLSSMDSIAKSIGNLRSQGLVG